MIKVNYNINGKIKGFYPDTVKYASIPIPFIEITEEEYKRIFKDQSKYRVIDKKIKDVSNDSDYKLEQEIFSKNNEINRLKNQISEIELAQHRTIREMLLYNTQEAQERLLETENKIDTLRKKMQEIQL